MSPPPRATPVTLPPDVRSRLRTFITDTKTIVVGLMGAGAFVAISWSSLATREDLASDRAASDKAHTALRLDVGTVQQRMNVIDEGNRWRDATLKAIADRLGVYTPPPPTVP